MIKIAFHDTHLGIRGSSIAMYDYADYNEKILNNSSIIIVPYSTSENIDQNEPLGIERFESRFKVLRYHTIEELEIILQYEKCDILYMIKYGKNDLPLPKGIKTVIHCVFEMKEPHGDVYAGVSSALASKFNHDLFVPHMISLEPSKTGENLRSELKIPEDAIVFGRYGGEDTMDILFCWRVIALVVLNYPNIYFLLGNTPQFLLHPRIIHLPKMTCPLEKNRFIQTCDAHIECGTMGHSFGLAIGEFSVNNKPIIAYNKPPIIYKNPLDIWNDSHIKILGDKGIYYSYEKEFFNVLTTFNPADYKNKDLNCYRDYSPENVMKIFKKVFID